MLKQDQYPCILRYERSILVIGFIAIVASFITIGIYTAKLFHLNRAENPTHLVDGVNCSHANVFFPSSLNNGTDVNQLCPYGYTSTAIVFGMLIGMLLGCVYCSCFNKYVKRFTHNRYTRINA